MKFFTLAAAITALSAGLAAPETRAQGNQGLGPFPTYRGQRYYEDNTYSRKPQRGYSGWAGPPLLGYFCDYRRYPIRDCSSGRCRTKGWQLQQYCY